MRYIDSVRRQVRRILGLRWQNHTGPFSDDAWGEVERAFADKISDPSPLHALNRIAQVHAKQVGISSLPWLDRESCSAVFDSWDISAFKDIFRIHNQRQPRHIAGTVIIVRHEKKLLLVDGTNRINYYENTFRNRSIPIVEISTNRHEIAGESAT